MAFKVIISPRSGWCGGVRGAVSALESALKNGGRIFTLGPIIHNPAVVEEYRARGVAALSSIDSVGPGDTVVIRSHGALLEDEEKLAASGATVIDATCPHVLRVRREAEKAAAGGKYVFIAGDPGHAEIQSYLSRLKDCCEAVENEAAARKLAAPAPAVLFAQTTFPADEFQRIAAALSEKIDGLEIRRTICDTSLNAFAGAAETARRADVMLVLGGRNSANTGRLAGICAAAGARTYHIERAGELRGEWLNGAEVVGIAAGASTPPSELNALRKRLVEEFDGSENDEEEDNER